MPRPPKNVVFSKTEAGRRLRTLRERRGISQMKLAEALGVTQSNVSAMERGLRGLTVHQVTKLAKALKVSTDEILVGTNGDHDTMPLTSLKLARRFQRMQALSEPRQRALLKILDALLAEERG